MPCRHASDQATAPSATCKHTSVRCSLLRSKAIRSEPTCMSAMCKLTYKWVHSRLNNTKSKSVSSKQSIRNSDGDVLGGFYYNESDGDASVCWW